MRCRTQNHISQQKEQDPSKVLLFFSGLAFTEQVMYNNLNPPAEGFIDVSFRADMLFLSACKQEVKAFICLKVNRISLLPGNGEVQ